MRCETIVSRAYVTGRAGFGCCCDVVKAEGYLRGCGPDGGIVWQMGGYLRESGAIGWEGDRKKKGRLVVETRCTSGGVDMAIYVVDGTAPANYSGLTHARQSSLSLIRPPLSPLPLLPLLSVTPPRGRRSIHTRLVKGRPSSSYKSLLRIPCPSQSPHANPSLLYCPSPLFQRCPQHGQLGSPHRHTPHYRRSVGHNLCPRAQVASLPKVTARATAWLAGIPTCRPSHALLHRSPLPLALSEWPPSQPKIKIAASNARFLVLLTRETHPMADGLP